MCSLVGEVYFSLCIFLMNLNYNFTKVYANFFPIKILFHLQYPPILLCQRLIPLVILHSYTTLTLPYTGMFLVGILTFPYFYYMARFYRDTELQKAIMSSDLDALVLATKSQSIWWSIFNPKPKQLRRESQKRSDLMDEASFNTQDSQIDLKKLPLMIAWTRCGAPRCPFTSNYLPHHLSGAR